MCVAGPLGSSAAPALRAAENAGTATSKSAVTREPSGRRGSGRVLVAPAKGSDFMTRLEFKNRWLVGSEHALRHDGLQEGGYAPTHHLGRPALPRGAQKERHTQRRPRRDCHVQEKCSGKLF